MTAMFVNLPVTDLERAKAFYTAIGFTINPLFTDHNAACVVVEDGHSYFMILVREFFQSFTDRPIGDSAATVSVATAIFLDSREAVDAHCPRPARRAPPLPGARRGTSPHPEQHLGGTAQGAAGGTFHLAA